MSRILFISKRHPQQRCLIERPYGRFRFLPEGLASIGHEVTTSLIGFRGDAVTRLKRNDVHLCSYDLRTEGPLTAWKRLTADAMSLKPDWIIGASDAWVGVLATRLAHLCGARLCLDAYDDFEAYMPWNIPLHWAWRHSLRNADVCTVAGPSLGALLDQHRRGRSPSVVVPMAADPQFTPADRSLSRHRLNLPTDIPLVGYIGSWSVSRGCQTLLEAMRVLRGTYPEARLVLSGRPPQSVAADHTVIALGYLDDAALPTALSALDVAVVMTADTRFGRSSHPAKLCEALACGVPVVGTETAPVRWMLRDTRVRHALVPPDDPLALASALSALLDRRHEPRVPDQCDWTASTRAMAEALTL